MGTKVSGLTAFTVPAVGDLVPVVDVSDTTQAGTGSTKKITWANFFAGYTGGTAITTLGTIATGVWNGTDIAVADGGTGRSTSTTAYGLIAAGTTATGAHQTLAAGATTEVLVGGGAAALPVWTTATGTGAPVRGTSPGFTTAANPASNDGAALGTTALGWSDLHLATGAVLNFSNGNVTVTHSSGILTLGSSMDLRLTTAGTNAASVVTVGGTQTLTNKTLASPTLTGTTTVATMNADVGTVAHLSFSRTLGTDHTYNGKDITAINAGATIAQFEAVYYDFTAGEWLLADANGSSTYPAQGIAAGASTDGNAITVITQGFVRDDTWNWSAGPIYLSATPGALTQTAPSTSGDKVQVVGFAVTADVAYFHFNQTYVTVA
jgi:hypothetical protein